MASAAAPGSEAPQRCWLERTALARSPSVTTLVASIAAEPRPFVLQGRWGLDREVAPEARVVVAGAAPSAVYEDELEPLARFDAMPALAEPAPAGAIGGGLVGWLGYGLGRVVEPSIGPQPPRPQPLPASHLCWYDDVVRRDETGVWWVEALVSDPDPAARSHVLAAALERWQRRLDAAPPPVVAALGPARIHRGAEAHRSAVRETIERITAGEVFQANICLRLEAQLDGPAAGLAAQVLERTDPWHGAWIQAGEDRAIVSASPELFLRRRGRRVRTGPIKGTAPRAAAAGDWATDPGAQDLLASTKDRAEHVMIVDLMRNDLGRVCDYGSVRPDPVPQVQAHAGVWHLVTSVEGDLHEGLGDGHLLRACFPPGSVTGAPKVQAMRVIAAVEGTGREIYTGAHGLASPAAGLELAVTIRTLECSGPRAWLGVGGGIVTDSTPDAELAEALTKATALLAAAGSSVVSDSGSDCDLTNVPRLPSSAQRPDPAAGLLGTMLVEDGCVRDLDRHLERVAGSAAALGYPALPAELRDRVVALAASAAERSRLRMLVRAAAAGATTPPELQLFAQPEGEMRVVALAPFVLPGGIGPHKWLDRGLIDAITADLGASPLLLDGDGTVLEAGWANVWWLEEDGVLCTPPLDGRQLPGIARGVLLQRAAHAGQPIAERSRRWSPDLAERPLLLTSATGISVGQLPGTPAATLSRACALAQQLAPVLADAPSTSTSSASGTVDRP